KHPSRRLPLPTSVPRRRNKSPPKALMTPRRSRKSNSPWSTPLVEEEDGNPRMAPDSISASTQSCHRPSIRRRLLVPRLPVLHNRAQIGKMGKVFLDQSCRPFMNSACRAEETYQRRAEQFSLVEKRYAARERTVMRLRVAAF